MTDAMLVGAAVLLGIGWWVLASRRKRAKQPLPTRGVDDMTVVPKPLLTESELSLYNLLQMAVRDHYLILAQVPLWTFVSLESSGKDRIRLVKHMALKRVDFALMHPGSRLVEQVVQTEEESPTPDQEEHLRIVESVIGNAGIKLVKVRSTKSYTIPELTALLGLADDA